MKIHLKQIPPEGLHLEGEEESPIAGLEAEEVRSIGPLRYNIDLGVSDDALWANGSLLQAVELRCVSCLEKFVCDIEVRAFAVHIERRGPETIDLTPFAREDVLLNLPAHPRCDRDGGRVCHASWSQRLRTDMKRKSDWSALDRLKLKS